MISENLDDILFEVNSWNSFNKFQSALNNSLQKINSFGSKESLVLTTQRNLFITEATTSRIIKNSERVVRVLIDSLPITLTLENFYPGSSIFIIDELGLSETHNITIDLNGFEANGSPSNIVIAKNFGFIELYCTSNNNFIVVREKLL